MKSYRPDPPDLVSTQWGPTSNSPVYVTSDSDDTFDVDGMVQTGWHDLQQTNAVESGGWWRPATNMADAPGVRGPSNLSLAAGLLSAAFLAHRSTKAEPGNCLRAGVHGVVGFFAGSLLAGFAETKLGR